MCHYDYGCCHRSLNVSDVDFIIADGGVTVGVAMSPAMSLTLVLFIASTLALMFALV
jgi:hypothetical protein